MKNLFRKAKILSMVILVLTFLGCEEDDEGSKLPAVTAGFTFDLVPNTGSVSFINISENANNFEWDFGNGTTSTEINPTVTFVTGTYTVSLTASNVAGASDAFEDTVTITIPEPPGPVAFPIDFDGTNVDYDAIVGDNIGFSVVTNPETGNDNTTNVGQMVAGGGQFQNVQFPLGTAVDFSGDDKTIELELFSSTEIAVLVKFEDGANGARDVEVGATHTGTGWETLSFDFATDAVASFIEGDAQNGQALVPDGQYSKMILFIGFNTDPGVEGTFLVDNISQTEGDGGDNMNGNTLEECDGGDLVNDFETADDSIFNNFGGGVGTIIDNPDTSVNMSAKVGQYVKNAGEVFGGITIEVDPDIDFNAGVFSIDVYSVAVRQLLFKLEGLNIEVVVPTSGTGWETITYDFSSVAGNMGMATAITLIMDNGTAGDGSADWTIQFDNIRLCSNESSGGGASLEDCGGDLVNDFETADDSIFNNFGGGVGTIIDNPDTSVNMSAKVGQYVKNAGEVFGGITIEVDPDIDFNAGVFSIDVYSVAVRQLLFKLEGLNIEVVVPTSGTGWETITYDFSSVAGNMGMATAITLIMDNGTAGDGSADWTIQFDNIRLCSNESSGGSGCTGPTMDVASFPVDFENCEGFNVSFGSLQTRAIVDNPVSGGINTSDKVYQFIKPNGADGFGGFQNVFSTGTFTNNSTITFKIYSTLPNQDIRLEIVAIPNDGGTIGNPAPYTQTLTNANEWVEMSFDLSANVFPNSGDETVYTMLVVKPGNIDGGNTPADVTFYVDDFAITAN